MLRLDGTLSDLLPQCAHLMDTFTYAAYVTGDTVYAEKKLQEWLTKTLLGRVVKNTEGNNVVWLTAETPNGPVWCLVDAPAPFDTMEVERANVSGERSDAREKAAAKPS